MRSRVIGLFGALALAAAQSARADDTVSLLRAYKVGDVSRYKMTANISIAGMEGMLSMNNKVEVKEIKPNGHIVLISTNESGHASFGGQEQDIPATPPVTETRDKRGRLVDYKREETQQSPFSPQVERLIAMLSETLRPEKTVKAGDAWTTELDNPALKDKKVAVKTTFIGVEKADGVDLWKVKQTAEVEVEGGKASYELTEWLDPKNGQMVKNEASVKDLPSQIGLMSMTFKMALVKDAAK